MIPFLRHLAGLTGALLILQMAAPARAADTPVAVAANFTEPAREIAAAFKQATGHTVNLSFGSSGQFYTQLTHGAPFEVFLSADAERPKKLEDEGLAVAGSRFTYAVGRLVLYSRTPGLVDGRGEVLRKGGFRSLAIADPETAPYGAAAIQTLTRLGLLETLRPKLVKGASITQAWQFVSTGSAELGFVSQSQVVNETGGSRWVVPAEDHQPIEQQAILLSTGKADPAAVSFMSFLRGPVARAIIRRYGYDQN